MSTQSNAVSVSRNYWFGAIPPNWRAVRADGVLEYRKEQARRSDFVGKRVFHYSIPSIQETGNGIEQDGEEIDSDKIALQGNELLVSKLNPRKGCVLISKPQPLPIVSSTEFVPLVAKSGMNLRFAYYLYASAEVREYISACVQSVTRSHQRANPEDIRKVWLPIPQLPEQDRIVAYLDTELGQVDELVAAKERWLEFLAEKRQALITHAVTRGINPEAPLRDSGIPWLGEVPAHWKLTPLRYAVTFLSGATPDKGNAQFWAGSIPWVSPKDMKRDEIADAEDHVSEEAIQNSALRLIPFSSVLIVVRGMILAHSFPTAITTQTVTINQDMKALVCMDWLAPRFLKFVFQGFTAWFVSAADQSAHGTKKLETETLGRFIIPLPPLAEQQDIVAHIAKETAKLDALRAAAENSIALLKERRGALISAAVTGKLRLPA